MRSMVGRYAPREPNTVISTGAGAENPNNRMLPQGAQTLGVKILAYAAGVLVSVLVARALGPSERGAWSVALLLASLLAQLADGGLSTSTLFLMRNRPDRVRTAVCMSTAMAAVFSIAVGLLLLFFKGVGLGRLLGIPFEVVLVVGLVVPVVTLLGLMRQVLTALGDLPGANVSVLGQALLLPVVLAIMLVAGPPRAAWVLRGYLAAAAITLGLTGFRLQQRVSPGPLWDARLLGTLLRLGVPSQFASVALSLTYRSDLFLVSHWLGLSAAGIYSIGLTGSEVLRGVPETGQALVLSRAVKADLSDHTGEVARLSVLATSVAGLSLALVAPVIVPMVFGEAYRGAVVVLACLVPGVVGLAVSYAISPLLFLEGRIVVSAIGAVAALCVLWAVSLYAPFELSVAKVALASSLAYWTLTAVQLGYLVRRGRIDLRAVVPGADDLARLVWVLCRRRRGCTDRVR
jgi:O-antigen/teichoic acid export membrane protein